MEPTLDRRNDQSERLPVSIDVELGQGDFQDAFAASSRNLSRGGISMRAPCLPDIGSRLLVRFQCLPSGKVVTAQAEVVWAHLDGERCGEFGVAFVDLDASSEWLIEEMLAEHVVGGGDDGSARALAAGPGAEVAAKVATLELEGGSGAIAARMASADGGKAVFEQDLELLRLGGPVRAQAPGAARRRGSIAGVELRMVGSVPMLAVTVRFGDDASDAATVQAATEQAGESDANAVEAGAGLTHDTEPDLAAPLAFDAAPSQPGEPARAASAAAAVAAAVAPTVTLTEFEVEPSASPTPEQAPPPPVERAARPIAPPPAVARTAPPPPPSPAPASSQPALAPPPPVRSEPPRAPRPPRQLEFESDAGRDYSTSFALPRRDDELDCELEERAAPAWKPAVARALHVIAEQSYVLLGWAARAAGAGYRKVLPQLRIALLRTHTLLRGVYAVRLSPVLGALRRFAGVQLRVRRRRTTGGPALARHSGSSLGRTLVLGVLGAGATALGVYALVPSGSDQIELHRRVEAKAGAEAAAAQAAAPAAETAADTPVATAEGGPPAAARLDTKAAPDPRQVPSARQVPAGSPFAVDVREGGAVAARAPGAPSGQKPSLRFGAASVPHARRFALRMSGRVTGLQGTPDPGGFSVTVLGVLSLDRAGPISSAHKAVARSMIINKGDRAELNIRFADGKRPAYQVSAEGSTLHVLIQDG